MAGKERVQDAGPAEMSNPCLSCAATPAPAETDRLTTARMTLVALNHIRQHRTLVDDLQRSVDAGNSVAQAIHEAWSLAEMDSGLELRREASGGRNEV